MAEYYIAINRGVNGTEASDFTVGTSSASSDDMEFRFSTSANLTREDLYLALCAIERYILDSLDFTQLGV